MSAWTLILIAPGCNTGEDPIPIVNSEFFEESELATLINNMINESSTENPVLANATEMASALRSVNPVIDPINGGNVVGNSLLVRNHKGLAMALKSHLISRHAYTIWWVVWNNPENCTVPGACSDVDFANAEAVGVDVMYAAGNIGCHRGVGEFRGQLRVGDTSGSINQTLNLGAPRGLLDAKKAEVHLVVRSHGPRIPGLLKSQTGSYDGGCTVYFEPFTAIPEAPGECAEIQFAIHQATVAI